MPRKCASSQTTPANPTSSPRLSTPKNTSTPGQTAAGMRDNAPLHVPVQFPRRAARNTDRLRAWHQPPISGVLATALHCVRSCCGSDGGSGRAKVRITGRRKRKGGKKTFSFSNDSNKCVWVSQNSRNPTKQMSNCGSQPCAYRPLIKSPPE